MDDGPPKPSEIRERSYAGYAVFMASALVLFSLMETANWIFAPADDRRATMQCFALIVGLVGIVWSMVLIGRTGEKN